MENEKWIKVKDYPKYFVSNFGNVKSFYKKDKPIILKPGVNKYGYFIVVLTNEIGKKTITVHKLVSIAFLGHNPIGRELVINHKDLDKQNNHVSNLEIVTDRENVSHYHESNKRHLPTGVTLNKKANKFIAKIYFKDRIIHLGTFITQERAESIYNNALKSIKDGTFVMPDPPKFSSKHKGVSYNRKTGKWDSYFYIKGNTHKIGVYNTEEDAYNAYTRFVNKLTK